MSVSLYLNIATKEIEKNIQNNIEYSKNNPYPTKELESALSTLGKDSNLAKIYDISGKKNTSLPPEIVIAAKQEAANYFPGLYDKLERGIKGLKKLARNEELKKINLTDDLNSKFNKFSEGIKSLKLNLENILSNKTTIDDFENILDDLDINLYSYSEIQKAAFIELYEKTKASTPTSSEKIDIESQKSANIEKKSPINQSVEKNINPAQASPNNASSPINSKPNTSNESTNIVSSDGAIISKPGEIVKEEVNPTSEKTSPININIEASLPKTNEPISEKNTTILNTSTSKLEKEVIQSSTPQPSPVNSESSVENREKIIKSDTQTSTSESINLIPEEKKEKGFLSKIKKSASAVGAALNLPSFKELGEQSTNLFGANIINTKSKISNIRKSFENNNDSINTKSSSSSLNNSINTESSSSSLNNSINNISKDSVGPQINESDVSSNIKNTSKNLEVSTENKVNLNVEKNSPSISSAPTSNTINQTTNTSESTSSPNILNTQTSPTTQPSSNLSNISNLTQNSSSAPQLSPPPSVTNIDMDQVVQSINRLERIILSGIEVTIKEI